VPGQHSRTSQIEVHLGSWIGQRLTRTLGLPISAVFEFSKWYNFDAWRAIFETKRRECATAHKHHRSANGLQRWCRQQNLPGLCI